MHYIVGRKHIKTIPLLDLHDTVSEKTQGVKKANSSVLLHIKYETRRNTIHTFICRKRKEENTRN